MVEGRREPLSINNSSQVSREWQDQGWKARMTKSRNGGGDFLLVWSFFAAPQLGVIVAHFSLTPQPSPTMPVDTSDTPTLPFTYGCTQSIIRAFAIFSGHRLRIRFRFSCLLLCPPRRTETAAPGRLCRFVVFFLFCLCLSFLTLSARPTPVSFKVTSQGKRRKEGLMSPPFGSLYHGQQAYPTTATRSTPDAA
ncbi:hypothetical protein BDP81DRAFT_443496 [Colletotrichum phormii]|uniref:Transmembrane protein n=1 Tax=Colletotrichum phormii TaxID=359342 RepID=A0AAI9ZDM2_9PEZI|nr:uncharacterized protein BDP81DRAFT_443496 [Colletotrichum phormii]KAK1621504.1 hypothetical protein BDP81DRAFT_443496 [Colletotrichum phormii]